MTVISTGYPTVEQYDECVGTTAEIADISTTRVKREFASGLVEMIVSYSSPDAADPAVGTVVYFAIDSVDDAAANAALAAAGSRYVIRLGETLSPFYFVAPACARIDFLGATAETGTSLIHIRGLAPV